MTDLREALADRIGRPESSAATSDETLAELKRRRQALAPEAAAGDPDALAELDAIEGELARHERDVELADLAAREQEARDRQTAAERLEQQRTEWANEKADAERDRAACLARCETAIVALVETVNEADLLSREVERLGRLLDPDFRERRIRNVIEDRLAVMLSTVGIRALTVPLGGSGGRSPLADVARDSPRDASDLLRNAEPGPDRPDAATRAGVCTVCTHRDAASIVAALDAKEPYRSIAERFGVSKSALSRHAKH